MHCPSSREGPRPNAVGGVASAGRPLRRTAVTVDGFSVRSVREGPLHRLTPQGELDIATFPIVEREFQVLSPLFNPKRVQHALDWIKVRGAQLLKGGS